MEAKEKPTEGVSDGEPDKATALKTALILYHINAVYTSRGGEKAFKRPHVSKFNLYRLWSGRLKKKTAPGRSCDTAPRKGEARL